MRDYINKILINLGVVGTWLMSIRGHGDKIIGWFVLCLKAF